MRDSERCSRKCYVTRIQGILYVRDRQSAVSSSIEENSHCVCALCALVVGLKHDLSLMWHYSSCRGPSARCTEENQDKSYDAYE
jgi:hypothetical protein